MAHRFAPAKYPLRLLEFPELVWTLTERKLCTLPRIEPHIQLAVSPCLLLFIHLIICKIYLFNDAPSILDCTESNYRI